MREDLCTGKYIRQVLLKWGKMGVKKRKKCSCSKQMTINNKYLINLQTTKIDRILMNYLKRKTLMRLILMEWLSQEQI
mgnify:FL=1